MVRSLPILLSVYLSIYLSVYLNIYFKKKCLKICFFVATIRSSCCGCVRTALDLGKQPQGFITVRLFAPLGMSQVNF
jgi:hypothetical protein